MIRALTNPVTCTTCVGHAVGVSSGAALVKHTARKHRERSRRAAEARQLRRADTHRGRRRLIRQGTERTISLGRRGRGRGGKGRARTERNTKGGRRGERREIPAVNRMYMKRRCTAKASTIGQCEQACAEIERLEHAAFTAYSNCSFSCCSS